MNDASRFWSKVDFLSSNGCWLWTAAKNRQGYGVFWLDGKTHLAHRISYELAREAVSAGVELDHRHTCPKNCINPTHLRPATSGQNKENFIGAQRNSKSGIRGVHWDQKARRWTAQVAHKGRSFHLGYFATPEDAESAARAKRLELHSRNDADRVTTPL